MKILELFSGTQSISKQFREAGHEVFTIDNNQKLSDTTDWTVDILQVTPKDIIEKFGKPDVIWASPPCEKFSVSSCYRHWSKDGDIYTAKSEGAILAQEIVKHTQYLIEELQPRCYFIENPRGMLRKMPFMQKYNEAGRYTVTYCQYGDYRQKPTDIWTNHPDPDFKPICKRGAPCHVSAPRGSSTGTQGKMSYLEKSKIPEGLCKHIVKITERMM